MSLLRSWLQDRLLGRVLKNSSYLFASYVLGGLLALITARLLGAADFGVLGIITVFSANINRLFSFRMGEMVVKYMGESLANNDRLRAAAAVKTAMLVEGTTSLLAFAALAALAPLGAVFFVKDASTAPLFILYGISIIANAFYETATGVLQVTNHYRSQALINFIQTVLVAVLLGLAAVYRADLLTVLWIYLLGKIILGVGPAAVAFYWLPRALGKDWWRAPLSVLPPWREVARFSLSTNFNGTVTLIARDSEVPIVSFFFGTAVAGYFKMALALINMVVLPINSFIATTYPEITHTFAAREWKRLRSLLNRVTLISASWTGLVVVGLVLGYKILFEPFTIFGRTFDLLVEYAPAYPALMIMLVGYGVANIFFWDRKLLLAQGLASYPFWVSFWAMLVKVALILVLLPRTSYLVQAALLSGYFLITVGLNVWRGLRGIDRAEGGLKIVCISTSTIPADTANSIQVMKACQGLVRSGHTVHLLLPGERSTGWESLAEQYGLTEPFEISWLPANPRMKRNDFAWAAVQRARKIGAGLIYTWTGQSAVFGLLVGLPVAFEVHDLPTGKMGPMWFRAFLRLRGKKRLLPITRALLDKLENGYGAIPAAQVVISPNGVDLEQYAGLPDAAAARLALGFPEQVTVLCAGHLYAGRGVDLFLGLAQRFPQASFVWVGGRSEEVDAYRARAAAGGLANVAFTGFIPQKRLPCYQAAADVLLMPYARSIAGSGGGNSAEICSPMKMFDYLAAGRAILSSDLPVVHEVLNEKNAVFTPPEDLASWSAALGRLLEDENLRLRLGEQARRDAEAYTWQVRAQRALTGLAE